MTYQDEIIKEVYVKHIVTGETKMYMVNALWTIKQFMIIINNKIVEDFNVEAFELVESDHMEPLLESDEYLYEQFGIEMNVAFYIRPINVTTDCIICYTVLPSVTHYFACSHVICHACMGEWSRHICPICRS